MASPSQAVGQICDKKTEVGGGRSRLYSSKNLTLDLSVPSIFLLIQKPTRKLGALVH